MSLPSQSFSQSQTQAQTQSPPLSQRVGTKRKRRAEHDAELLLLLQGPSAEIIVGTGHETASWTIPVALLAKHSDYLRDNLSIPVKEEGSPVALTTAKITLADRDPDVFCVFVQWMYFGSVPDRFGLSRLSTGKAVSNSFQLWTLGDYLQADKFKDRIMRELYNSNSLDGYTSELGFVEFTAAEIDYCWSQTAKGSKLRTFILDTLSHHIVFGDYIRITGDNDWNKLFVKHADLHMQIVATIAASANTFSDDVAAIPRLESYLEGTKVETETATNGPTEL